jgi:arginine utilization protein RocB
LLVIPFAALVAGRSVLSNREQKKKEIEAEIKSAEKRKKKELAGSNSLVFVSFYNSLIKQKGNTCVLSVHPHG